jgi:hypothetical protein
LFELQSEARTEAVQLELGLAIARMVGDERYYLQQWRALRHDFNAATVQAILAMQKPARRLGGSDLEPVLERCAERFGENDVSGGVAYLQQVVEKVALVEDDETIREIMQRCNKALARPGPTRPDLILLSLHVLDAAWNKA